MTWYLFRGQRKHQGILQPWQAAYPPHAGTMRASSERNSNMSAGYSGTKTVLAMLINNPDIIENPEKIPNEIGAGSRPLERTIARSSAHDLLTVRGASLRSLRSISSDAAANNNGDNGQPCRIPLVIAYPGKREPPNATSQKFEA